jgi:hypothetical protein
LQHAVSRTNSGFWHRTTQDDDLLAKDGVFDTEGGAGSEGRTQRAHGGFEDFDEHRGERASTGGSADKSWRKLRPVRLDTEYLRRTTLPLRLCSEARLFDHFDFRDLDPVCSPSASFS